MKQTYNIYEENWPRLEKRLKAISKKCKTYGTEFHFRKVGEEIKPFTDEDGKQINLKFFVVEASGVAQIAGWEFAGTIEHTANGNIITGYTEETLPERFFTAPCQCEHCKSKRRRNNTYIVKNIETGEYKQVGKSCLRDYTNGLSAEAVTAWVAGFESLIKGETPGDGGERKVYVETREILSYMAECIRIYGYVKRDAWSGECTADRAWRYYAAAHNWGGVWMQESNRQTRHEMDGIGFDVTRKIVQSKVDDALDWASRIEDKGNVYMHNLKVACGLEYCEKSSGGIIASLFPTYDRNLEYEAERRAREAQREAEARCESNSSYQGTVGKRITINGLQKIRVLTSWETQWGTTSIVKLVDMSGNVYTWKTSSFPQSVWTKIDAYGEAEACKDMVLTGTVKEHKEYRGIMQTELQRCRIA